MEKYRFYERTTQGTDIVSERQHFLDGDIVSKRINEERMLAVEAGREFDYTYMPEKDEWNLAITWQYEGKCFYRVVYATLEKGGEK